MDNSGLVGKIGPIAAVAIGFAESLAAPVVDLAIRILIGMVVFKSGLQKLQDGDSSVFLFQEEYKISIPPPEVAASLGAFNELTMPILLIFGLAARRATAPLMGMSLVIQFVPGASNPAYDSMEHF